MTMPATNPREALAQRVRGILATHRDVREVNMFGGLSFMVNGRMAVAAGRDGGLLVRTDPADYDRLRQQGAEPAFMGGDRPMGARWLEVPPARIHDAAELAFWVGVGIESGAA